MAGINHVDVKASGQKGFAAEWNKDHQQKGNHDCEKFQHLNHIIENRVAFPAGPVAGQIIYRTDTKTLYIYDGANWVDYTVRVEWSELVYVNSSKFPAILAHSATDWTAVNGASTLITADAGVSWNPANADIADMTGVSKVSRGDKTKAISCDHDSGNISITADSGNNWASAAADPAAITKVLDLSFPTSTRAVVGCDLGAAARGIFYSADSGNNWVICTSGPAVDVHMIDMVDGSNGLAIDVLGNIWFTINGGVDWTDSGQNIDENVLKTQPTIIALTSTTGVMLINSIHEQVETFNTTGAGAKRLWIPDADEAVCYFSNLIKTTNGNIYFVQYTFPQNFVTIMTLYKSEDSGVTWSQRALGVQKFELPAELTANNSKSQLVEYDTNKLLIIVGQKQLMKIDES